ncbi:hypothetical protein CU102_24035 [Phyllobacterium brassicacearum]|uniref:Uncharacterized protein n=1 Tax=Phyllobacterium brassicacearum TaxID=314235 RepID=A0A2P7BA45_9HYPH|nr:hypothetical protein [Phyllobacterium brassicacearum]PSH63336.1 hypothetical protein CU102_24035 [Phyllobacterium brassicacearum]TDQ18187.1 hypothetical protein DEV91_12550 [Phyllobacterium brassicacearum]
MTSKSKYTEYREKWRAESLEPGHVETKLFLPREEHEKVVAMAQMLGARIPVVLGQLVVSGLAAMAGRPPKTMEPIPAPIPPQPNDLLILCEMIDKSRFANDTGSTRYRQIAFINRLAAEIYNGRRPTIQGLAKSVDSHYSQLELLSKVMENRGVVTRVHVPGLTEKRAGKVLYIRDDAIEALNQAHIDQVGYALLPLEVQPSEIDPVNS